ncbi:hypothetical protein SCL_2560 [Sulfuricaulis limicola]|uniref:Uncharacterized protein n=2 Tax=Sulfuricaulis limicola TaxID=1620215 RepID=A0A1B4XJ57_9GAMM|nr:hypothetical protein SCL_2560 [Sulfuricaulis limicola]
MPAIKLMALFEGYYVENGIAPENREQLEAYAGKADKQIEWKYFPLVEFFQTANENVIRTDIVSRSSAVESGEIRTSWKFHLSRTSSSEKNIHVAISPLSYVCVRGKTDPADTMGKFFLELVIGYLAKSPVPRSTESCLRPYADQADTTNQRTDLMKKKLDEKMKVLQMKSKEAPQGAN